MTSLREIVSFQTAEKQYAGDGGGKMSFGGGYGSRMKTRVMLGVGLSLCCAIAAGVLSYSWFNSQFDRMNQQADIQPVAPVMVSTQTVVVASDALSFGAELTRGNLREIEWHAEDVPEGAFRSVDELLVDPQRRYVLTPMTRNEPVLTTKISNPGQPASLAALLDEGMKAVTIRVDDVLGVAGLIHPGDRVDVLYTRVDNSPSARDEDNFSELLLRDVKVLALDQRVNDGARDDGDDAFVARAVTIEVDVVEAQKVALSASAGKLHLALRHLGAEVLETMRRVTMNDLSARTGGGEHRVIADDVPADATDATFTPVAYTSETRAQPSRSAAERPLARIDRYVVVGVTRGLERREYNVVSEDR